MKIGYDSEMDALCIRLIEGKHECRTMRLNNEVALNIGAKEVLAAGKLPQMSVENLPFVAA